MISDDFKFAKGGQTEMGLTPRTKALAERAKEREADQIMELNNVIRAEARFAAKSRRYHLGQLARRGKKPTKDGDLWV